MQLSEECLEIIEQARHEDSPDIKENLEEDSESSDDDSEERERSPEASRLAAEGQLPRNRRVRTLTEKGRFFHSLQSARVHEIEGVSSVRDGSV